MDILLLDVEKPEETNFIFGMSHFIKTVEDIHEAIVQTNPSLKFGLAFCEASGPCLIRISGNSEKLIEIARKNAEKIGAGHTFFVFMEDGFPISVLNAIQNVPEVCGIFCATANAAKIAVISDGAGRGVLGVIDGVSPRGVEGAGEIRKRKDFLRMIGYKL
ncbi:adenosine-specific kinase [bacterium]|nr:adenosine-specific kinase [candidate division CSSED10-310 bacterium]